MHPTDYFPSARLNPGRALFVAPLASNRSGLAWNVARNSIQSAVDIAAAGDTIYIAPGTYDETVTIERGLNLSIIGVGPWGSVKIAPSTANASGLLVHADDCLVENLVVECPDTTGTVALTVTGSRFRGSWLKLMGGAKQLVVGPGLNALVTADDPTRGAGVDMVFQHCELASGTQGLVLTGTDYGPAAQIVLRNCLFNRLTTSSIDETNSSGSSSNQFRNLLVDRCVFEPAQDGTEPTNYILLNDSNSNTGLVTACYFTVALNSAKNLVSTACKWVGCLHPAGISTTQPS